MTAVPRAKWTPRAHGGFECRAGGFVLTVTNQSDRGCGWCWHVLLTSPDHNGEIAGGGRRASAVEAQAAAEQYARDFCAQTLLAIGSVDHEAR